MLTGITWERRQGGNVSTNHLRLPPPPIPQSSTFIPQLPAWQQAASNWLVNFLLFTQLEQCPLVFMTCCGLCCLCVKVKWTAHDLSQVCSIQLLEFQHLYFNSAPNWPVYHQNCTVSLMTIFVWNGSVTRTGMRGVRGSMQHERKHQTHTQKREPLLRLEHVWRVCEGSFSFLRRPIWCCTLAKRTAKQQTEDALFVRLLNRTFHYLIRCQGKKKKKKSKIH